MTHSYLLVTWQGGIQRVDSDGPITETAIQSKLGSEFETCEWGAGNCVLTLCFNSRGAQSGLPKNVKFKANCGDMLIGISEQGTFRGLTEKECDEFVTFISHAL